MMMGLALYKRIALGALVLTLVTYEVKQVTYNDKRQVPIPSGATSIAEINQYVLSHSRSMVKKYLSNFSSSQAEDVIRQMGLGNFTSEILQQQFLTCAGLSLLKNLPVNIPPSHQHCRKMSFQHSGPVVALGSFPGSGNSWVRLLLEAATGIYTGAIYCDGSYVEAGMIGEGVTTENVIAIKSHASPEVTKNLINYDKAIYIVRSPFGSILAEQKRLLAKKAYKESNGEMSMQQRHTLQVDLDFDGRSWESKVKAMSKKWKKRVALWLNVSEYPRPVLFVGYDNLVNNTYAELKRMLDFIGHPYTEDDILCAVKRSGEGFHRNHTNEHVNPYSPELQDFVLNEIKEIDASLQKHNIFLYHPYH